jgi:hypothetical protein
MASGISAIDPKFRRTGRKIGEKMSAEGAALTEIECRTFGACRAPDRIEFET